MYSRGCEVPPVPPSEMALFELNSSYLVDTYSVPAHKNMSDCIKFQQMHQCDLRALFAGINLYRQSLILQWQYLYIRPSPGLFVCFRRNITLQRAISLCNNIFQDCFILWVSFSKSDSLSRRWKVLQICPLPITCVWRHNSIPVWFCPNVNLSLSVRLIKLSGQPPIPVWMSRRVWKFVTFLSSLSQIFHRSRWLNEVLEYEWMSESY